MPLKGKNQPPPVRKPITLVRYTAPVSYQGKQFPSTEAMRAYARDKAFVLAKDNHPRIAQPKVPQPAPSPSLPKPVVVANMPRPPVQQAISAQLNAANQGARPAPPSPMAQLLQKPVVVANTPLPIVQRAILFEPNFVPWSVPPRSFPYELKVYLTPDQRNELLTRVALLVVKLVDRRQPANPVALAHTDVQGPECSFKDNETVSVDLTKDQQNGLALRTYALDVKLFQVQARLFGCGLVYTDLKHELNLFPWDQRSETISPFEPEENYKVLKKMRLNAHPQEHRSAGAAALIQALSKR